MYLINDYFLNEYNKDLKTDLEIMEFIKKSFPETQGDAVQDSYVKSILSFFGYVCYPFSVNELTNALGSFLGSPSGRKRFDRAIEFGSLAGYNFKSGDMGCKKAYYVPGKRADEVSSTLPPFLRNSLKYRRCGGAVPAHDYGVGMSILQFMLLEKPFIVEKEVNYSMSYKKSKGSLCIDAVMIYPDEDLLVYLEQDMGTEKHFDLVCKLYLYHKHELSRNKGCVLFSSHNVMAYPKCLSYKRSKLLPLYEFMEQNDIMDFHIFNELYSEIVGEELREAFRAVAVRVGYLLAYDGDKRLEASEITADTPLSVNRNMNPFTLGEFKRYIDELYSGNNPYRQRDYNRQQAKAATFKFRGMCEILCRYVLKKAFEAGELRALLCDGFSCLVYPTVLLPRSYEYMKFTKREEIIKTLRLYYTDMGSSSYSFYSPFVNFEGGLEHCQLRNCFTLPDGTLLCVEHIGRDVGAFIRFFYLYVFRRFLQTPLHLVALVENESEIMYFAKMCEFEDSDVAVKKKPFSLLFYMYNQPELGRLIGLKRNYEGDAVTGYYISHLLTAQEYDAIR